MPRNVNVLIAPSPVPLSLTVPAASRRPVIDIERCWMAARALPFPDKHVVASNSARPGGGAIGPTGGRVQPRPMPPPTPTSSASSDAGALTTAGTTGWCRPTSSLVPAQGRPRPTSASVSTSSGRGRPGKRPRADRLVIYPELRELEVSSIRRSDRILHGHSITGVGQRRRLPAAPDTGGEGGDSVAALAVSRAEKATAGIQSLKSDSHQSGDGRP